MRVPVALVKTVAFVTAVVFTVGCASGAPSPGTDAGGAQGRPAIARVAVRDLPQLPAHGPDEPLATPTAPPGRDDPAGAATLLVVSGLTAQGLEVVDVGATVISRHAQRATVRVAATHRPVGGGAPHTSIYDLRLALHVDKGWELAGAETIQ